MSEEVKINHELKMWPMFFDQLLADEKPWEFRNRDRDFRVGDEVFYREWCPLRSGFTGRTERVIILQIVTDGDLIAFKQMRTSTYKKSLCETRGG